MFTSRDLQIIVLFIISAGLFIMFAPPNEVIVRAMLGVPLVLFLPGYALIVALFPGKNNLSGIERFALSFGFSIAIVPLIGFVLDFISFGIRLVPVLLSISFFTLVMCLIAYFRRVRLPEEERFEVPFSYVYRSLKSEMLNPKSRVDKILMIILVLSIVVLIIALTYIAATPRQGEKFTEFYILGDKGKAENYTTQLKAGMNSSITVGIVNHEYIPTNYILDILLENNSLSRTRIYLKDNSTWEGKVFFTPRRTGDNLDLDFLLYKENSWTAPYRDLRLWVNITR
jgi:uncharacterized membrane protein